MHLLFTIKAIKENISFLFLEKKQIMLKMLKKGRGKTEKRKSAKKGKKWRKRAVTFFP